MKKDLCSFITVSLGVLTLLLVNGCFSDGPLVVKSWDNVSIRAGNEAPAPAGRDEEGLASLKLYFDNSLRYTVSIGNLPAGDTLTACRIHFGGAGSNGIVVVDLKPSFAGATASGITKNLRRGQIDTLLNQPIYINLYSVKSGSGVARGQLNKRISMDWE
jgi:hypothetical protein